MRHRHRSGRCLLLLLIALSTLGAIWSAPAATAPPEPSIDPYILQQIAVSPDGRAGFFIQFAPQANLAPAYQIADWEQRGRFVHDQLQATAERSQGRVRVWLEDRGLDYQAFALANALFVTADRGVLQELAAFPEIAAFRGNHLHPLEPQPTAALLDAPSGVAWNISLVRADRVWTDFAVKGQGVLVANIDTGVEYSHDALAANYQCGAGPHEDCWYDPAEVCPNPGVPCDNEGHGTHVMGTMVGDDDPHLAYNAGMAPDAHWIACKGCESQTCSDFALTACADWLLAPGGDAANRPHIVNNSWGGAGCDSWYQPQVQAWRAAGIFPAFSAGNSGSGCATVGSPADYAQSFATGACDAYDNIAWFSSRGPSCMGGIKPEVTAPGVNVCSAVPGNDWSCGYSGTSMASPHSAGLVALLWSANPALVGQIEATEHAITSTAVCREDLSCGGSPCHNNVYGWGRIDAYMAVAMASQTGELRGEVQHALDGSPLAGVNVRAQGNLDFPFSTDTDAAGRYSLTLPLGSYTVSAALYGYSPQTVTGVPVLSGTVSTQDFALQPRPRHVVSGTVSEAGSGSPLFARITAEDAPIPSAWTNPASGFYSLTLIEDDYSLRAAALLHLSERTPLELEQDRTANFDLEPIRCALLVDDDANRPDVRAYYTSTLDDLGLSYQVWDVAERGPPGIEDLLGHHAIFWWTGNDNQEPLSAVDEAVLQDYLDAWGRLFLSSQSYLQGGESQLQRDYLRVASFTADTRSLEPLGNRGDPIGEGLGPYLLLPPEGWQGPLRTDDVVHDGSGGASAPFRWAASGQDNSIDYDAGSFRTVFLAWPFEGLASPLARRTLMGAVLGFFGECRPTGLLLGRVLDANTGLPLEGAAVSPIAEGDLDAAQLQSSADGQGHFTLTLPAGSYELTVYQEGYRPEVLAAISVPASIVTRLEIPLRSPQLGHEPAAFSWELLWEQRVTATAILSNVGTAGPLHWEISQQPVPRPGQQAASASSQRLRATPNPADVAPPGAEPLAPSPAGQTEAWGFETPLPSARYRSASFYGPDDGFFVGGGFDQDSNCLAELVRYDPGSGDWTTLSPMPTARANLQAAVVDGIAYLVGGFCNGHYYSTLEAYDIAADAWISGLAPLPQARSGALVAALDGYVYACGGGGGGAANRCWRYDPAQDGWQEIAPMPGLASYGAAFAYEGALYVVAGWTGSQVSDAFWRYDPTLDVWEAGPPLNQGRMSPALNVYGGAAHVLSGGGPEFLWEPNSTGERYDLEQWPEGNWQLLPEVVPVPVVAPAHACVADRLHLAGGVGESIVKRHQVLDEGCSCYRPREDEGPSWLAVEPLNGSLELGERQELTLEVDAAVLSDPGCYYRRLQVQDDTVYGPATMPLTLCVAPTADLGKLQGSVQSLGYCDQEALSLTAAVHIAGPAGLSWTVSGDETGRYYRWLHAGSYTVTAAAPQHLSRTGWIEVRPAETTTLDIDLRYLTPCLELRPAELSLSVPTGTLLQRTLLLSDGGAAPLNWQVQEAIRPRPFRAFPEPIPAGSGGPPAGYRWSDSQSAGGPAFEWVELAGMGRELFPGDEHYVSMTMPFSFSLYDTVYTPGRTLRVGGHGTLFAQGYGASYNECLPTTRYQWLIAPFWDHLEYAQGHLYSHLFGQPPHRVWLLEWSEMLKSANLPTQTVSLQAALFEGSDDILFQYKKVMGRPGYDELGGSATVGIQADALHYLEYSCNEPVLTESLSICFEPPGSVPGCGVLWQDVAWLQVGPTGGQVPADGAVALTIEIDTRGLSPGLYRAALAVESDDARRPLLYVPVTLAVGLEPRIYLPLLGRGSGF
ncbi:MAG: S8 family serine peptidase [Chloroflexia bacterium]|nr:S8 family serine peptidase [Chloroflexia bacterium]